MLKAQISAQGHLFDGRSYEMDENHPGYDIIRKENVKLPKQEE